MGQCSCSMLRVLFMFLTVLKNKTSLQHSNYPSKRIQILDFPLSQWRIPLFTSFAMQCWCFCQRILRNSSTIAFLAEHFHVFKQLKRIMVLLKKWLRYVSISHLWFPFTHDACPSADAGKREKLHRQKFKEVLRTQNRMARRGSLSSVMIRWGKNIVYIL